METVTVEGKVYQINELYLFHYGDMAQAKLGELCSVESSQFINENGEAFPRCSNDIKLGTIEDAPLELEDGEWYMCSYKAYGHNVENPYYYAGGFKTTSNSMAWHKAPDDVKPLCKMIKA